MKTNGSGKCKVFSDVLETSGNHHRAGIDTRNRYYKPLGVRTGQNCFQGLERVSVPDLHMLDLVYTNISRIVQVYDGLDSGMSCHKW